MNAMIDNPRKSAAGQQETKTTNKSLPESGCSRPSVLKGPPLKLANAGSGPAGTDPTAGDQLQPWRRMKDAHQRVHQRHPIQLRGTLHAPSKNFGLIAH